LSNTVNRQTQRNTWKYKLLGGGTHGWQRTQIYDQRR